MSAVSLDLIRGLYYYAWAVGLLLMTVILQR